MPGHFPQSAVYQKALEIFTISSSISRYMMDDLNAIKKDGSEDPNIYFTGDIVQQSVSLGPEILMAESQPFAEEKRKHVDSVTRLTNLLYKNCERLERANSRGKEFLPVLRHELKKFRKLQRSWMLTL